MRKIVVSFALLLCLCFSFVFVGCDDGMPKEYWKQTSQNLTEFLNSDDFNNSLNITFSDNVNTLMSKPYGESYAELKNVFVPIYEQSVFCAQRYSNVFLAVPTKDSSALKNKFKNINNSLEALKKQITTFNEEKNEFESFINFTDEENATSGIEITRLSKFKLEFIKLLNSSYNLSNNILSAYTLGYYNFINLDEVAQDDLTTSQIEVNLKLATNASNLQLVNSSIKVLLKYNNKEMPTDFDSFWQGSQRYFKEVVQKYYNQDYSRYVSKDVHLRLGIWKGVYDQFVQDSNLFNGIIGQIQVDVLKACNNNLEEYAERTNNPSDYAKADFYLNYYKNVQLLHGYTIFLLQI